MIILTCPKCGERAKESPTKYGIRSSCCDLWSWGGAPLVSAETHDARKRAHEVFDVIWKGVNACMTRTKAYRMLAHYLGIPKKQCHMKLMSTEMARRVPDIVGTIMKDQPRRIWVIEEEEKMRVRQGFVSNSSSSSFVFVGIKVRKDSVDNTDGEFGEKAYRNGFRYIDDGEDGFPDEVYGIVGKMIAEGDDYDFDVVDFPLKDVLELQNKIRIEMGIDGEMSIISGTRMT